MINPDLTVAQAHAAAKQFRLWLVEERGFKSARITFFGVNIDGQFYAYIHASEAWKRPDGHGAHEELDLVFDERGAPDYPHVRSLRERELRRLSAQIAPLIEDADRYATDFAKGFVEDLKRKRDEIAGLLTAEAAT